MSSSFSHKTVNAYRNSAKKVANNPNLKNILQRAQLKDKKKLSLSQIQSDNENEEPPDFDCNAGVRLSDSSDDEEIPTTSKVAKKTIPQEEPKMKSNPVKDSIESSGSAINMNKILQNLQEAEKDTEQLRNIQTKRLNINQETDNMNISQLLMLELGETGSTAKSSKKRTQDEMDSDSDEWEEVEGKKIKIPEHRLKVRKLLKKFRYEE